MNHPLLQQLQTLSQLLSSHSNLATNREAVKALDKVAISTRAAIDLLQAAALGTPPEAQELQRLLERAFGTDATPKAANAFLKPLLGKLPTSKQGTSLADYFALIVQAAAKGGNTGTVCSRIREHLDRPRFDATATDEYELLKQIRQLGQMDAQQKKAAKAHLLNNPALVVRLSEAASIKTTTGKVCKPVSTASLVTKLIQHGERYAENAGS